VKLQKENGIEKQRRRKIATITTFTLAPHFANTMLSAVVASRIAEKIYAKIEILSMKNQKCCKKFSLGFS